MKTKKVTVTLNDGTKVEAQYSYWESTREVMARELGIMRDPSKMEREATTESVQMPRLHYMASSLGEVSNWAERFQRYMEKRCQEICTAIENEGKYLNWRIREIEVESIPIEELDEDIQKELERSSEKLEEY